MPCMRTVSADGLGISYQSVKSMTHFGAKDRVLKYHFDLSLLSSNQFNFAPFLYLFRLSNPKPPVVGLA